MKTIIKKLFLAIAVASMVVAMFVVSASAATYPITGSYSNFNWSIAEDGTCTITPMDSITDGQITFAGGFDEYVNMFGGNNDLIKKIVVENTANVTITTYFGGINCMPNLETVIIPDTVTQYGGTWSEGMFAYCPKLTTVGRASSYTDGVVDLSWMGNTYADGKYYAFCPGSTSIKAIKFEGLTGGLYLNTGTFEGCTALESITLPNSGWTQIEAGAFNNCTSLKTVVILEPFNYDNPWPAGDPFSGCPIETIIIKNKDNLLAAQANLKAFCDAKVAAGVAIYDYDEYNIGDSVEGTLADAQLEWSLSGDGVLTITPTDTGMMLVASDDFVFNAVLKKYENNIKTVRIVNTDSIQLETFFGGINNLPNLETIIVPDTVTSWGGKYGGYGFGNNPKLTTLVKQSDYDNGVRDLIDFSWFNIPWGDGRWQHIFAGCSSITNIEFGNSGYYWLRGTFQNCTSLTTVTLPETASDYDLQICEDAFAGCSALESLYISQNDPEWFDETAELAFAGCSNLTIYCVEGTNAYTIAQRLVNAGIIKGVAPYVKPSVYPITGSVDEAYLTWEITEDGTMIITPTSTAMELAHNQEHPVRILLQSYKDLIKTIQIVNTDSVELTSFIGGINDMPELETIIIPDTVTRWLGKWDSYGFSGNIKLTTFVKQSDYDDGVRNVIDFSWFNIDDGHDKYKYIFAGCSSITSVEFGSGGFYWLRGTFQNCTSLKTVILPASASDYDVQICEEAFAGCSALESLIVFQNDPEWFDETAELAFAGCTDLTIYCMEGTNTQTIAQRLADAGVIKGVTALGEIVSSDGYSIRSSGYNGIRAEFSADKTDFANWSKAGFDVVEYGAIVSTAANRAEYGTGLVLEGGEYVTANERIIKKAIYKDGAIINKILESNNSVTRYALSLINVTEADYQTDVYMCAYVILKDQNGNEIIRFADYDNEDFVETNLYDLTKFAVDSGAVSADNPIAKPVLDSVPEPEPALPPEEE
ncbi:MAG: hypothetical protein E7671_04085 [Ruminococcaceae bacterium]|nr:hypothetical protein [Oscillospiraceae bacterium]